MAFGRFNLKGFSEREKQLVSLVLELQERLNKATAIALHYHPCGDSYKSCNDHLDEVYAHLKYQGLITEEKYYDVLEDNFFGK